MKDRGAGPDKFEIDCAGWQQYEMANRSDVLLINFAAAIFWSDSIRKTACVGATHPSGQIDPNHPPSQGYID